MICPYSDFQKYTSIIGPRADEPTTPEKKQQVILKRMTEAFLYD